MAGQLVTKRELSALFRISAHDIDRAIDRGAPVHSRGTTKKEGYRINTAAWFAWTIADAQGSVDPVRVAQTELMRANADLKSRQLAELEGKTLTTGNVVKLFAGEAEIVRTFTRQIPKRCAERIATTTDAAEIEDILSDEINVALGRISGDEQD